MEEVNQAPARLLPRDVIRNVFPSKKQEQFFSIFFSVTSVSAFLAFSFQKLVGKCLYMPQL